jgi:large subunit ribosomal protein L4e
MIKRAVDAFRSNRRQRYGPSPSSGMRHSVETWGKGRGVSRVQRVVNQFRGAQSPGTVGGRRAHPPKMSSWSKKLNKKERRAAKLSALAATAAPKMVKSRGHAIETDRALPIVVEDKFEEIDSTRDMIETLEKLELYDDVIRARSGTHIRAGKGKMRSRLYKVPKSILVVVSDFKGVEKGLKNLPGVDIVLPQGLNAEVLAPGGVPGRLTLYTEGAIETIRRWQE